MGNFIQIEINLFFFKLIRKIFIEFYLIKVNISNLYRGILFKIIPIKNKELISCDISVNFKDIKKKQMENLKCTFLENFFNEGFYKLLVENFPSKNIFFKQKKYYKIHTQH